MSNCWKPGSPTLPGTCRQATWSPKYGRRISRAWHANWAHIVERAAPGRQVELRVHDQPSEGGMRVLLANDRAQLDQTFEARQSRLADELARVAMERLFASTPDLGTLIHG